MEVDSFKVEFRYTDPKEFAGILDNGTRISVKSKYFKTDTTFRRDRYVFLTISPGRFAGEPAQTLVIPCI